MFRCVSSSKALRQRYLLLRVGVFSKSAQPHLIGCASETYEYIRYRSLHPLANTGCITIAFVQGGNRNRSRHSKISFGCGCRVC